MKTLVVYYSRTWTTKIVAEYIANKLSCDTEELIDLKDRSWPINYMLAWRDAIKKVLTDIKEIKNNPKDYDLIILATPVWAFTISSAIRTYVENNKDSFKNIAFVATQWWEWVQGKFKDLRILTWKEPIFEIDFLTRDVRNGKFKEKLDKIIENL